MLHKYIFLLLFTFGFTITAHAGKKLRVLFLGNSYTHYNNMPQIVADMATTTGDTLTYDMYAPGGYTLDNHGKDAISLNKIKASGWDYLVLQEQSQLPSFPGYFSNELYGMCELFRQYNPCGRIMFYMTWGRKNGDAGNCPTWPPVCTYMGMDSLIRLRYEEMAVKYHAELSPAGAAWRHTRTHYPGINLYEPDESHPSAAGSYLIASSFYTAIFKKNPTLVSYNFSLSPADAVTLRQSAKAVVFDSLSFWNHEITLPTAKFTYTIGTGINEIVCLNASVYADSYLWDFGDGATSTIQHPKHNYANNGTYTITLTVFNCDIDTTYQTIYQKTVTFCPHTPTITPLTHPICPGTTDTLWTQQYDAYQWYDEYHNPVPGATGQWLEVSSSSSFYVETTLNGCSEFSAPVTVYSAGVYSPWFIMPSGNMVGMDTACIGDTVVLEVKFNKPPVAHDTLIDWTFNGQPVTGYHNDTLLITQAGTYEATVRHELCPNLYNTKQLNITFINCPDNVAKIRPTPFIVAPNPVSGMLTISSPAFNSGTYTISITNSFGQTVYRQPSARSQQQYIDLSPYSNGVYFISVTGERNPIYRGKVVKQ